VCEEGVSVVAVLLDYYVFFEPFVEVVGELVRQV
jgi:hypothetical protein